MQTKLSKQQQALYLVKLLCENSAHRSKSELPDKFWRLEEWNKFFKLQIIFTHKYLKDYEFEFLASFINQRGIYSLAAKWIPDALSKFRPVKIQRIEVDIVEKSLGQINKDIDFGYLD